MDRRIFDEMKVGKDMAFESFVKEYNGLVFAYAYSILENRDLAEEVRQKVFIKVATKINQVRDLAKFDSWLYRLTYHACMDEVRSSSYKNEVPTDLESMFENFYQKEENESNEVWSMLKKLPKNKQTILLGKYVFEFSEEELAEAMDIPLGTLKSRLFRAKNEFKEVLVANNLGRLNLAIVGPSAFAVLKAFGDAQAGNTTQTSASMVSSFAKHKSQVHIAKVVTGVSATAVIGVGAYLLFRQPIEPKAAVIPEPCMIEEIKYDEAFTNEDIHIDVVLSCGKAEKITINDVETTKVDENGEYEIKVYSNGKVSDTQKINIDSMDKVEPQVSGDFFDEQGNYYMRFTDDGSGVKDITVLENGKSMTNYNYNESTQTVSFYFNEGSVYTITAVDEAGNLVEVAIE